jgi:hypothetical protein
MISFEISLFSRGVHIVYLPPYSPDLNPIEEAFSSVKAWVRRRSGVVRTAMESANPEDAEGMLQRAVISAVTREKARGWFRDSGYLI